jgi:hypothetical protein
MQRMQNIYILTTYANLNPSTRDKKMDRKRNIYLVFWDASIHNLSFTRSILCLFNKSLLLFIFKAR